MDNKDKKQTLEKAYALGYEYEQKHGSCPQCALAALEETLGSIDEQVFKASHALAGGAALTGQGSCGALAGGMLAISAKYGRDWASFKGSSSRKAAKLSKLLHDKFVAEFGSPICAGVQETIFGRSFNLWDAEDFQAFEEAGGHRDKCPDVVGKTAMWTAEILLEAEDET
jgi:C_GCAxxG_C_C family probable redox protein